MSGGGGALRSSTSVPRSTRCRENTPASVVSSSRRSPTVSSTTSGSLAASGCSSKYCPIARQSAAPSVPPRCPPASSLGRVPAGVLPPRRPVVRRALLRAAPDGHAPRRRCDRRRRARSTTSSASAATCWTSWGRGCRTSPTAPARLTVLGMNAAELAENPQASDTVVHDLNAAPRLPFADASFDDVVCCASVDYLDRAGRGVPRHRARAATGWAVRLHLLEPLLPDQGDPRLAGGHRRAALRDRRPVLRPRRRLRGAGRARPACPRRATGWGDPLFAVWSRSVHSIP